MSVGKFHCFLAIKLRLLLMSLCPFPKNEDNFLYSVIHIGTITSAVITPRSI